MKTTIIVTLKLIIILLISINISFSQIPGSNQLPLKASKIPQFKDPLPHFAGKRVDVKSGGDIIIKEVPHRQVVLSTGTLLNNNKDTVGKTPGAGFTKMWGYSISKDKGATWTNPYSPVNTIETQQGYLVRVTYRNDLYGQTYDSLGLIVDQTLNWAAPEVIGNIKTDPYNGPVPMVVHLHGGEQPSASDGGPNAWFTPGYGLKGPGFTKGVDSIYYYPNTQQATTLWFHDHAMGVSRLNVYAGLAGQYIIRGNDEEADKLPGWSGDDLVKEKAPAGTSGVFDTVAYLPEIELAIQDRMFDTLGQIFWTVQPPNPDTHPFWTPEFFGNVMTVNGKTWPYLSVAPRKYRFHFLNICNARFLNMWLKDLTNTNTLPIKQIGTDGALLDSPVTINPASGDKLLLATSERADVVIDFTGLTPGTILTLLNDANAPFPGGDTVIPGYTDRIMQFIVNGEMVSAANSQNAGMDKSNLPINLRSTPLIKLTDFAGKLNIKPVKKRQLTLSEIEGAGGPLISFLNNSRFYAIGGNQFGATTEFPEEGTTELWQIINTTDDAHPIHIHLIQFQLVSRQAYDTGRFKAAYRAAFPGGMVIAGGGPPNPYDSLNADSAVGGNPAISQFLLPPVKPARQNEMGWKDTYVAYPGEVTTFIARFAPTDKPLNASRSELIFNFNPGIGPGYVWHCHILDHEDNEMMRPYSVRPLLVYSASGMKGIEGYALEQNNPNPLNTETEIHFITPVAGHVNLTLYNIHGAEVQTIINADKPAGNHSVKVSGEKLAAGLYFYTLKAGDFTDTKKLAVVK